MRSALVVLLVLMTAATVMPANTTAHIGYPHAGPCADDGVVHVHHTGATNFCVAVPTLASDQARGQATPQGR